MANSRFGKLQAFARVKEKQGAYAVPANCTRVVVPRANGEVWHKLAARVNRPMKSRDTRLGNIQPSLVCGAIAVIKMMEAFTVASRPGARP